MRQSEMRTIVVIDTSVFLNAIDVPGFNQNRDLVFRELETLVESPSTNLLLPFACIIETGNHIAQLSNGQQRRNAAIKFQKQVAAAIDGIAPWPPTSAIDLRELKILIDRFPESATKAVGLGDLSIIREWELACDRHPHYRVRVWSLDHQLSAYDRAAAPI